MMTIGWKDGEMSVTGIFLQPAPPGAGRSLAHCGVMPHENRSGVRDGRAIVPPLQSYFV